MTIFTISVVNGTYYLFMEFSDLDVCERFAWCSPVVHRVAISMVHHGGMDKLTTSSKIEALACAGASLILGAYLASSAENLAMQVIMLSFPPAALLVAIRRTRAASVANAPMTQSTIEPSTFEEVTAGLDFDILSRAS